MTKIPGIFFQARWRHVTVSCGSVTMTWVRSCRLLCSVSGWVLAILSAEGLQGSGWRRLLHGEGVFASSVSHSHVKLSDPLVLAFGFFPCLNVAGSAAAMAGVEVQGKNLTQRPELYHRTIHIFKAHSVRALNYFSPVIFGWVTLLSAPRTSRTPSFPNENYFKPFRSQK